MPASAASSSWSDVSPETPTAPSRVPSAALHQHAAGHRHQRADRVRDGGDEVRLLLGALHQRPRAHPQRHGAVRLAVGDLEPLVRRAVLALDCDHMAAGVEDHDGERLEGAVAAGRQGAGDDRAGLGEGQGHESPFWPSSLPGGAGAGSARCSRRAGSAPRRPGRGRRRTPRRRTTAPSAGSRARPAARRPRRPSGGTPPRPRRRSPRRAAASWPRAATRSGRWRGPPSARCRGCRGPWSSRRRRRSSASRSRARPAGCSRSRRSCPRRDHVGRVRQRDGEQLLDRRTPPAR